MDDFGQDIGSLGLQMLIKNLPIQIYLHGTRLYSYTAVHFLTPGVTTRFLSF